MGRSSLTRTGEQKPRVGVGHGTGALGPSDTSDSGSDVTGGPGMSFEAGNLPDMTKGTFSETAGPDLGDANLDSDSDSRGTGERAAAGHDTHDRPEDITTDRVFTVSEAQEPGEGPAPPAGNRRPGRGNRLRRGLRSRRKSARLR